jgi:CDP-glucose 4,6-dehydratase
MTLWLSHLGADVTGYSLPPSTRPNFFDAVGLSEGISSITGDIRRLNLLSSAMRTVDPEFVFHFAAQPLVREAFAAPVETFSTNMMGTVNVLQAMRGCENVEAAIIFTTDKVYENTESGEDYREPDRLGGREPYGASKACSEIAVEAYRHSYFKDNFPVATVRAGNIIGGGDWSADRIVPDAVRSFSAGRPLKIRNPDAVRPWQHALDPARGLLLLAEKMVSGSPVSTSLNFGPAADNAVTVGSLVDTLTALWGNGATWAAEKSADAPYEAKLLHLDSSLASSEIGWKTAWSLERALNATVDWYQGFLARNDMRALSLAQITAMERAN